MRSGCALPVLPPRSSSSSPSRGAPSSRPAGSTMFPPERRCRLRWVRERKTAIRPQGLMSPVRRGSQPILTVPYTIFTATWSAAGLRARVSPRGAGESFRISSGGLHQARVIGTVFVLSAAGWGDQPHRRGGSRRFWGAGRNGRLHRENEGGSGRWYGDSRCRRDSLRHRSLPRGQRRAAGKSPPFQVLPRRPVRPLMLRLSTLPARAGPPPARLRSPFGINLTARPIRAGK